MFQYDTNLASVLEKLKEHGVVAGPTETVYGLFCHGHSAAGICALRALKDRTPGKPFQVLVESLERAASLAVFSSPARKLASAFWPGPLTLVVKRKPGTEPLVDVTPGEETIGLRVPNHPFPLALIHALNAPLIATSANRSGEPPCSGVAQLRQEFETDGVLIADALPAPKGIASTVVDITGGAPVMLREGAVSAENIRHVLAG